MKSTTNRDMGGIKLAPSASRLRTANEREHAQLTGPTEPSKTGALSGRVRRFLSFLAPSGRRPRVRPFGPASFASVAIPCAAFLAALCLFAAPPASAQTASKLVSNTGQLNAISGSTLNNDLAQAFTTGSHAGGYKLTRVDVQLRQQAADAPTYSLRIHSVSFGRPGSSIGTLANPSSLPRSADQVAQFSASGGGIDLAANTTYFVVIDVTSASVRNSVIVPLTASDAQDTGAAAGWSIADGGFFRGYSSSSSDSWISSTNARKIAVHGYAKGAVTPTPGAPTVIAPSPQTVESDWRYVPSGVSTGGKFRLLFVTSTGIAATSSNIATYNTHVQNAANGNADLRPFKGEFRALISTPTVHARDNTATTGTGVPIYWLGGAKVADNYADFYDGIWDSVAGKTEAGGSASGWQVWTGSNRDGTRRDQGAGGSGANVIAVTVRHGGAASMPYAKTNTYALFALSPVITVRGSPTPPVPPPAEAQAPTIKTIWSAWLTVGQYGAQLGCITAFRGTPGQCSSKTNLTDNEFTYGSTTATVDKLFWQSDNHRLILALAGRSFLATKRLLGSTTLHVDGRSFAFGDATEYNAAPNWRNVGDLGWTRGQRVRVSLTEPLAPATLPGLKAIPGDGQVTLTWDNPNWFIPLLPKDSLIINGRRYYRWQYRQREGSGMWGAWTDGTVTADDGSVNLSPYQITVVTGLSNDTAYSFEVRGWAGRDNYFAATSAVSATPRASVAPVRVTPGPKADELTVAWTSVPAATRHDHGGFGGYCFLRTSGAEKWDDPDVLGREFCVGHSNTSAVIRDLEPGTQYKVRVYWSWNMRWVDQFKLLGEATGTPGAAADQMITGAAQPGLEWARVNGAELALRFDAALDESSVPASSAFPVTVGDAARGVSAVAVSQDMVTLTLAQAVSAGETVWVAYTPPSSGRLRRAGGGDLLPFAGQAVTNDTPSSGAEQQRPPPEAVEPPPAPSPLTARVSRAPSEHDGGEFAVRVRFSEAVETKAKDAAFGVSGGSVVKARRVNGRSDLWQVDVAPAGQGAVTVTLPATTDCAASGAVCTADGRKLETALTHTVQGPLTLSVADARAQEGPGVTMDFAVTLSRAASGEVTVRYATRDGTAKKGRDYTKAKGTLTFAAGEKAAHSTNALI